MTTLQTDLRILNRLAAVIIGLEITLRAAGVIAVGLVTYAIAQIVFA